MSIEPTMDERTERMLELGRQYEQLAGEKQALREQLEAAREALLSLKQSTSGSAGKVWVEGALDGEVGNLDALEAVTRERDAALRAVNAMGQACHCGAWKQAALANEGVSDAELKEQKP